MVVSQQLTPSRREHIMSCNLLSIISPSFYLSIFKYPVVNHKGFHKTNIWDQQVTNGPLINTD